MELIINGERKEFATQITLEELLEILHLKEKVMAAAVNMQIIKQNEWATHLLCQNDKVELLDFVGGG